MGLWVSWAFPPEARHLGDEPVCPGQGWLVSCEASWRPRLTRRVRLWGGSLTRESEDGAWFLDSSHAPTRGAHWAGPRVACNLVPMGMGQCSQHRAVAGPRGGAAPGLWLGSAPADPRESPAHPHQLLPDRDLFHPQVRVLREPSRQPEPKNQHVSLASLRGRPRGACGQVGFARWVSVWRRGPEAGGCEAWEDVFPQVLLGKHGQEMVAAARLPDAEGLEERLGLRPLLSLVC